MPRIHVYAVAVAVLIPLASGMTACSGDDSPPTNGNPLAGGPAGDGDMTTPVAPAPTPGPVTPTPGPTPNTTPPTTPVTPTPVAPTPPSTPTPSGDGDMASGDGDMASGDGDMASGDGDMAAGDGDSLGGPLMFTGPFTATPMAIIDSKYKCPMPFGGGSGQNVSPPIAWSGGPAETESFALVLYDTGYDMLHWVIWDIPKTATELPEGLMSGFSLSDPAGAHQASAMGSDPHAYAGPCSSGVIANTAKYEFRLYALNTATLAVTESQSAAEAQAAVEAAMLESVVYVGKTE